MVRAIETSPGRPPSNDDSFLLELDVYLDIMVKIFFKKIEEIFLLKSEGIALSDL